jgi:hypothetical protein
MTTIEEIKEIHKESGCFFGKIQIEGNETSYGITV